MTFKIGDRIKAYTSGGVFVGKIEKFTDWGSIEAVCECKNSTETVTLFFHPKQCRKLKPKQRREWWINIQGIEKDESEFLSGRFYLQDWFNHPDGQYIRTTPPPSKEGWIKVREVKG